LLVILSAAKYLIALCRGNEQEEIVAVPNPPTRRSPSIGGREVSAENTSLLKRGRRIVGLAEDLPNSALKSIKHVHMHRRHKHLDAELKNWKP
jgi:hypothetical protein